MQPRIMYVEFKGRGIEGPARIGLVAFSKTGRTVYYRGRSLRRTAGYKANFIDVETGGRYWVSGPRKDGCDALYGGIVEIDDDIREEYWTTIRGLPRSRHLTRFASPGKYAR